MTRLLAPTRRRLSQLVAGLALGLFARPAVAQTTSIPSQVENMVRTWAPIVWQQTFSPAAPRTSFETNLIVAVDFDGNSDTRDNVTHARNLQPGYNREATIYYSAVETGDDYGHGLFFLTYYFYHIRDAGAPLVADFGHQNDLEGVQFVIKKSVYTPRGYMVASLTQAHGGLIPWLPHWFTYASGAVPVHGYSGYQEWLQDYWSLMAPRPVVVSAGNTHGVYSPQACGSTMQQYPDYGIGIDYVASANSQYVEFCAAGGVVLYHPELGPVWGGSLANGDESSATMFYRLVELYPSVMWQNRLGDSFNPSSSLISMFGGSTGLASFYSEGGGNAGNPPWAWRGDQEGQAGFYWDTWGCDGKTCGGSRRSSASPIPGAFLTAPQSDIGFRYINFPDLGFPARYNPYLATPPDYSIGNVDLAATYNLSPGPIAVIHGPIAVRPGSNCNWYASTAVTAPIFFAWSIDGNIIGSSSDVWYTAGSSSFQLVFQVFDAEGNGASTSVNVTVSDDAPMCYIE